MNQLLEKCRDAWMALEPVRAERRRCKRLTYGTAGSSPNNLVRQLVKSTVGRYRYLRAGAKVDIDADVSRNLDLDARSLEEFLISAIAVNYHHDQKGWVNISPEQIFFTRFAERDASDVCFIGLLHDMPSTELLQRFAGASTLRSRELLAHYRGRTHSTAPIPCVERTVEFDSPSLPGCMRVIEVWEKIPCHTLLCHDLDKAEFLSFPYSDGTLARLNAINQKRRAANRPLVVINIDTTSVWLRSFLTPAGLILAQSRHHIAALPFCLLLYPMTDGETHSLVADVAPQQEHINSLVALLDRVIDHSAKGVLLFPTEQLPDGFSWRDMRRIWADPGGIIPYKRTSRSLSPQMVSSSGWNQGAAQMLKLQLDLFAEISGLAPSFRGREAAFAGSEAAKVDSENASIALLDMMAAFHSFIATRKQKDASQSRRENSLSYISHPA